MSNELNITNSTLERKLCNKKVNFDDKTEVLESKTSDIDTSVVILNLFYPS